MKQIQFLVTNDLRQDQRMHRICSALHRSGYSVRLVGRRSVGSATFTEERFPWKRIFCFFRKGFLFYAEYNIKLFFYLLFSRSDAICAVDLDTIIPAGLVCKIKSKKLIYDAHEYFPESIEIAFRPRVKRFWAWIGDRFVPEANLLYTVNRSLAEKLGSLYKKDFQYILNVPEKLNEKSEGAKHAKKVILYQGVLNEGRGLEILIEAMRTVNAVCWIAGEGILKESLEFLIEEYDLGEKITLLGFQNPSALRKITQKADIGINILDHRSGNYSLSLANKTFDYMHANVPAIHMNFPEYKSLNQEFRIGLLLEEYSESALINALNSLINDETLFNELKENCKQASLKYNWQEESKKLLQLYKTVV